LWRGRLGSAIAMERNPQEGVKMIRNALKQLSASVLMSNWPRARPHCYALWSKHSRSPASLT